MLLVKEVGVVRRYLVSYGGSAYLRRRPYLESKKGTVMRKILFLNGMASMLALVSSSALALPFNSFDPRSLAMGGTGVASGTAANAGFMNPALLAAAKEDEDFALELPIIAGRVYDQGDVWKEVDNYQNGNYESNFNTAVAAFTASQTDANALAVASTGQSLLTQLLKLSNKNLQGEGMVGFVVGIPSRKIGASLTIDAWAVGGGVLDITSADQTTLQNMIAAGNTSAAALLANGTITSASLTSNLKARGAVIGEVGLSLAREVDLFGTPVAVGVTPKAVKVRTFDYVVDVNTASFDASQGKKEYSGANLDIGLVKDYKNGWKTGVVAKNLVSKEYETVLGNKIKIEPQFRAGVSHATDWSTVALDVDLKENKPVGLDTKTQYIGLGAEVNVFSLFQVRIGYRHNMKDSTTSVPTVGLGFSPFGAHLDFAAGGNSDEKEASLQLGFRF